VLDADARPAGRARRLAPRPDTEAARAALVRSFLCVGLGGGWICAISVAPMMDWTDRHCRSLHRVLSSRALLYTEMVTSGAVVHGDREKLLGYDAEPASGGAATGRVGSGRTGQAARIGEDYGYDEINLNVGCPSDRVQSGRFGACLMREPDLVAECMAAIKDAVKVPATVKCRIGVDDQDPEEALFALVDRCAAAGSRASWSMPARPG
jgi:tRNA-dihydrouridine synthase A